MGVKNKGNALYWATGIDNSGLKTDAEESKNIIKNMSDDVKKTASNTSDAIDKIGKQAIDSARSQIEQVKATIKRLEEMLPGLKDKLTKTAPGSAREQALINWDEANRSLNAQKTILAGLESQVEGVADNHVKLRTQIMNAKQALSEMEMQGKRGTPEFEAMRKKLGELNDQFKDTAAQATILANDERGFAAIAQTVSGMAGAMSAATGVVSLFGEENENMAKVQMRLQAVMAITIGLQQVAEMLNKDSYFSVVLLSKAKEYMAATELKLATSIGVSTAAARAFLIATGAVAIVGLFALVAVINKVSEAHKEQTKASVEAAKKENELQAEVTKGFATEQSKIQAILTSLHSENVSRENKLKMIKQLKEMIPGYTAELSKEGAVIRENKKAIDDYMISLEKSLKLKAAEKELEGLYTKLYELQKLSVTGKEGNQFTSGIAVQNQSESDKSFQKTKEGISRAAEEGIGTVKSQIEAVKAYISKNGLISDVVLGVEKDQTTKEVYNAVKDLQALLLDINQQTATLLLEQQEDSLQKRLQAIDQEKEAELQKIREKQIAIIEQYNKSNKDNPGFTPLSTKPSDLSASVSAIDPQTGSSLQTAIVGVLSAYGEKAKAETSKWNTEILELAREFADKRVQIAFDYNEKIKKLESEGQVEAAEKARQQRDKAISEETASYIENSKLFKELTDEKLDISRQATEALLDDLREQMLAEWEAGRLTVDQMNEFMDQINEAREKISSNDNNPFAQLGLAITGRKEAKESYKKGLQDPKTTEAELAELESKAKKADKAVASAAAASLYGVQDILQSVVGGLDQLGVLNDQQKKDAENIIGMVGGAANIAQGIATGNPMAIIQGSVDLLVNGYQLFDTRTKDANKEIANQKQAVESLKKSYEALEKAIDDAFSTTKAGLINEEIANLQAQNQAIAKQIQAEKGKKKPDDSVIGEWQTTIEENRDKIEDLNKSIIEALTGTSVMSAIDSFAQAYADAWSSGENAARKSTEVVRNLIKNSLIEYLKSKLQPEVNSIMTAIANAMNDGQVSEAEQNAIDVLTSAMDKKAAEYQQALNPYLNSAASGVTGQLQAAMTEGTGSQLVGLWNMTAMDIRFIREFISTNYAQTNSLQDNVRNINKILDDIQAIKDNTGKTANNTEGLVAAVNALKTELQEIKNNTKNGSRL